MTHYKDKVWELESEMERLMTTVAIANLYLVSAPEHTPEIKAAMGKLEEILKAATKGGKKEKGKQ